MWSLRLCVAVLSILAWPTCAGGARSHPDDAAMTEQGRSCSVLGALAGPFELSHWVRGGEPGPDRVNESLELRRGAPNGPVTATLTRATFDFAVSPPQGSERFAGPVPSADVERLVRAMADTRLFERRFDAERDRQLADALVETWELEAGGGRCAKTFHEPLPPELEPAREVLVRLRDSLARSGARQPVPRPPG